MVKSKTSAPAPSHKVSPEERSKRNTGHPLLRGEPQMGDFIAAAQKRREQEEMIIDRIEEWKSCLNRLAATSDGKHFFKHMLKASNLFTPGVSRDTVKAVEDKQRQDFYLRHVRPYLDKSVRVEFE